MKKILIIRFSSLGDIILSFPLINALKKEFPESEIHYLTKEMYEPLLKLNPKISNLLLFNNQELSEVKDEIKKESYDLVLDIHKNFRSKLVTSFTGLKVRSYKKDSFKKFLLVKFKINLFKKIIPVYLKYINSFGTDFGNKYNDFTSTELLFEKQRKYDFNYLVLAPSSKHFTKTYPKEKYAALVKELPFKVILIGDKTETDLAICKYIEEETDAVNLCGELNYNELANMIYNSEYVITNDSAILHFSEAVGKKVKTFIGSTVKEFGFFPQLKNSVVFENNNLKCRPCTHIGLRACPLGHFKCMNEIEVHKINFLN